MSLERYRPVVVPLTKDEEMYAVMGNMWDKTHKENFPPAFTEKYGNPVPFMGTWRRLTEGDRGVVPMYKKLTFTQFVRRIRYRSFIHNADAMANQLNLPVNDRATMERAFTFRLLQLYDDTEIEDMRYLVDKVVKDEKEARAKRKKDLEEALEDRFGEKIEEYWQKKQLNYGLSNEQVKAIPDDYFEGYKEPDGDIEMEVDEEDEDDEDDGDGMEVDKPVTTSLAIRMK